MAPQKALRLLLQVCCKLGKWQLQVLFTARGGVVNRRDAKGAKRNEQFKLNITAAGAADISDPASWGLLSPFSGDLIVRGIGGLGSADQLSGQWFYSGTLDVTTASAPEPAAALLALGIAGIGYQQRKRMTG